MVQRVNLTQETIIGSVGDPSLLQDAATKNYVDTRGSTTRQIAAISTANVIPSGAQTVDGYTVLDGDYILLTAQTDAATQGLYIASTTVAWTKQVTIVFQSVFSLNGTSNGLKQYSRTAATPNETWILSAITAGSLTPGGLDTQFQYNSAGAFAGTPALTYDATNVRVSTSAPVIASNLARLADVQAASAGLRPVNTVGILLHIGELNITGTYTNNTGIGTATFVGTSQLVIAGVAPLVNSQVLFVAQTAGLQNGSYNVTANSASAFTLTRTNIVPVFGNFWVATNTSSTNYGIQYENVTAPPITVGTTALIFAQFGVPNGATPTWQAVMTSGNFVNATASGTPLILRDSQAIPKQITLQTPPAITASYSLTLPLAQATAANQPLVTSGIGGVLSWGSVPTLQSILNANNLATNAPGNTNAIRLFDSTSRFITFIDSGTIQCRSYSLEANNSVGFTFLPSQVMTSNQFITMPPVAGTSGQVLTNTGSNLTSWATPSGASTTRIIGAISTVNITPSGAQTVDGYVVVTGDYILLTAQSDATTQGLYIASTAGAWAKQTTIVFQAVFSFNGTANGRKQYSRTSATPNETWILSAITSATGVPDTLQQVLNTGNTATNASGGVSRIILTDVATNKPTQIDGTAVQSQSLQLLGSTSGTLDIKPAATTTNYTLFFPGAQGSANQSLLNDGSGNLSWVFDTLQRAVNLGNSITNTIGNTGIILITDSVSVKTTTLDGTRVKSQSLVLDGSTQGSTTIKAAATTTSYPLTLPAAQATAAGQTLSNDGTGVLSWASGAAASLQAVLNVGNTATNTGSNTSTILLTDSLTAKTTTLDGNRVMTQNVVFDGATSGNLTLRTASATNSYLLTLPAAQGIAGQTLSNDGTGALSWSTFYATVENPASVAVTKRPTIQFTGSGVASVMDDPTNNRTVVTITGGGGGGSFTSSAIWTGGTSTKDAYISAGVVNSVGITINLTASSGSGGITAATVYLNSVALLGTFSSSGTWPNLVITIGTAALTGNAAETANTVTITVTGTFGGAGVNIANAGMLTNIQPTAFTTTLTGSYALASTPFYTTTGTLNYAYGNTVGTITTFGGIFNPGGSANVVSGTFTNIALTGSSISGNATGTGLNGAGLLSVPLSGNVPAVPIYTPAFYVQSADATVPNFTTASLQTPGSQINATITYPVATAFAQYDWVATTQALNKVILVTRFGNTPLVPDVTSTAVISGFTFNIFGFTSLTVGEAARILITA